MAETINFNDEIERILDREPFFPFTIIVSSGDRYEVTDPHQLAMGDSVIVLVRSTLAFFRKNQVVGVEATGPVA